MQIMKLNDMSQLFVEEDHIIHIPRRDKHLRTEDVIALHLGKNGGAQSKFASKKCREKRKV